MAKLVHYYCTKCWWEKPDSLPLHVTFVCPKCGSDRIKPLPTGASLPDTTTTTTTQEGHHDKA